MRPSYTTTKEQLIATAKEQLRKQGQPVNEVEVVGLVERDGKTEEIAIDGLKFSFI